MPETILLRASAPVSHKSGELLSLSPEEMRVQMAEPREAPSVTDITTFLELVKGPQETHSGRLGGKRADRMVS